MIEFMEFRIKFCKKNEHSCTETDYINFECDIEYEDDEEKIKLLRKISEFVESLED